MMIKHYLLALLAAAFVSAPALADCVLRQSDAMELKLGPFVDSTDGNTDETGLTISQADVQIAKCAAAGDCGAFAQKNDAGSCAHDAIGIYECDFNATDTDTVGILEIAVHESGALPVFKTCAVVETAIYDSLYADGIGGLATAAALNTVDDFVDTEVAAILADTGTDGVAIADDSITAAKIAASAITNSEVSFDGSELTAIPDVDTLLEALVVLGARQTADSGTTTTIVDAALTQATNDWFKGMGVHFVSSTLAGQDACVTGFTAASDTLTFAPAVTTAVTTHQYYLLPNSECFSGASGSGATAQEVWEYATRALTILDEDSTTLDLNNTTVGTLATLDEDSTTLDLNATAVGAAASVTAVSSGAITEASFATTAGSFAPLGITDQGTAQSATSTTLVLRAATPFSSDDAARGQTLWAFGSDQGYWQSETITTYTTATDTATVDTWDVTPSGTITYKVFGTAQAASGSGSGATAQEVWEYSARTLTALDEDTTTLDLNNTTVGSLATFDEDSTTIDINATTLGTVTTATNVTTVNGLAAGVVTAAAVATGAIDADAAAADLSTEIWSAATRTLTALDEDGTTIDLDGSTVGTATNVGGVSVRTAVGMSSANLDTQLSNLDAAVVLGRTQILIATADSGDTNTLVDTQLTFANAEDIDGAYVVRSDGQRCFVDSFDPGTDTIEFGSCAFTGAWSTQAYKIYPANTQ